MTRYKSDFARIEYEPETDAVVGRLMEFTSGEEFREYMDAYIDILETEDTNKIIADTSQFDSALTEEDQAWSARDWAPRAVDAGLDYLALVMPEEMVAEMSVESVVDQFDDPIERNFFDDIDEARDWIAEQ